MLIKLPLTEYGLCVIYNGIKVQNQADLRTRQRAPKEEVLKIMFENFRKMILQHAIVMAAGISLMIYGGQRLYINWIYDKCEGLKLFFIILAFVAVVITIINASHWGKRQTTGGNPNYQGQRPQQ